MSSILKILYLSHRVPFPPNKGEKIRTYYQIRHLIEAGHEVSVLFPAENDEDFQQGQALAAELGCEVTGYRLDHKLLRLAKGLLKGQPLSVANFFTPDLLEALDKASAFDALVCTASSMAEYVFRQGLTGEKSAQLKLIMDFMDLDSDKWRQYAAQSGWPMRWIYSREARLLGQYEVRIASKFDACLFVAEAEAALFRQNHPQLSNILAIENGMDTSAFWPAEQPAPLNSPVFLFTGVMDYAPNVDAVLWFVNSLWDKVRNTWPTARFIVAGMNPEPRIQALAKKAGIEVTGFVEDILPYYHQANIFVAPFRMARGVQNKILQSFACGLPVITTAKGLEGIHATDGTHLLLAETPDEYLSQINRLLSDAELYHSIRSQAQALIQARYSWHGALTPLVQLLEKPIARYSAPSAETSAINEKSA